MATIHPVFLLLLAWSQAVPAHVEPPTNVTLHCHNRINVVIVKWSYEKFLPGLKFRVFVGSLSSRPQVIWVDPPNLQAEFSSDLTNDYYTSVKAVIGENESVSAPTGGIKFSYFKESPADRICFMDFPAVNVTAQDNHVRFSFTHPWLLYNYNITSGKMNRRDGEPIPEFQYSVVIDGQRDQKFFCDDSVCEDKFILMNHSQKKYCLKVDGLIDGMQVKATQSYCAERIDQPQNDKGFAFIFIGVALLALLLFGFIFFMVYKKKTKPSSSTPTSMTFYGRVRQLVLPLPEDQIIVPDVEPASPTPLLLTPEEEEFTPIATVPAEPEHRLRIGKHEEGVSNTDEGVCEDIEVGNREESYMPGKNMEDDVTDSSDAADHGYEKRPVVVDMGQGENAEGYRG